MAYSMMWYGFITIITLGVVFVVVGLPFVQNQNRWLNDVSTLNGLLTLAVALYALAVITLHTTLGKRNGKADRFRGFFVHAGLAAAPIAPLFLTWETKPLVKDNIHCLKNKRPEERPLVQGTSYVVNSDSECVYVKRDDSNPPKSQDSTSFAASDNSDS